MKTALVTGAIGHAGSFLVRDLANQGWKVIATDLESSQRKQVMTKETVFSESYEYLSIEHENVTFIAADLRDKESLRGLFQDSIDYDVIFHPASLYDYFAELDILMEINHGGLKNFLEVIDEHYQKLGKPMPRFMHFSTCGVYGEPEYERDEEGFLIPITEDAPFDPPNNYSISKKEQEVLLHEWEEKKNLEYTIVRSAPIYGPYQTYGMFHIYYMVYKIGTMVLPYISPPQRKLMMPMIHVEDLVAATIYLSDKEEAIGEAYSVVADSTTQEEWLEFLFQELGVPYVRIPIHWRLYEVAAAIMRKYIHKQTLKAREMGLRPRIDLPMIEYVTHNYFFSNEKLRATGFEYKYPDFISGTRQTMRWYIDHGWFESEPFGDLPYPEKYSKKARKARKAQAEGGKN